MKNHLKQFSTLFLILVAAQSISAQEVVKPVKKAAPSTETINCVKCPVKKDSKGYVMYKSKDPKKRDTLKKAKTN